MTGGTCARLSPSRPLAPSYSALNAVPGDTRVARQAGIRLASTATASRVKVTAPRTTGCPRDCWSTSSGRPAEGRQALERLAQELHNTREPELAGAASELAWSERAPAETRVAPLSDDVERVIAEER